jgi:hypothetical protein
VGSPNIRTLFLDLAVPSPGSFDLQLEVVVDLSLDLLEMVVEDRMIFHVLQHPVVVDRSLKVGKAFDDPIFKVYAVLLQLLQLVDSSEEIKHIF